MNVIAKAIRLACVHRLFSNWLEVTYQLQMKYNTIRVVLRNSAKGVVSRQCVRAMLDEIEFYRRTDFLKRIGSAGGYLTIDGIMLDPNLGYAECLFILSGWKKENGIFVNHHYNVKSVVQSSVFEETFALNSYDADVKNKEVVDVGANVGDTALYFALKGAKDVYAFEPIPLIADIAKKNIEINNVYNRVHLFNAGVGSKDGFIKVPSSIDILESLGYSTNKGGEIEVPVISLKTIVDKFVKDPYLLKMDCEGCEADVLFGSDDSILSRFDKIIFEHHYKNTKIPYTKYVERLNEIGFDCVLKEGFPYTNKKKIGIIRCTKKA